MKGILDFCPWCGEKLVDLENETRWIHDIINHRGYWEAQMGDEPRNIIENLYDVIEYYHGKTNGNITP